MKTGIVFVVGVWLSWVAQVALAQPGTVPGVQLAEPPNRPESPARLQPTLDAQGLPVTDSTKRAMLKRRYLALDVTGMMGRFRRYRIFPGEVISFKNKTERTHYRSPLTSINDTSFTIAFQNELYEQPQPLSFAVADVRRVYINRRIPFVSQAAYILPVAAVVYLVADFVNGRDDNNRLAVHLDHRNLVPAGLLVLGGGICYAFSHRSYSTSGRNQLKILWTR
ncbi:hypothetical protein J2I47_10830 [Fibrella sp. HMF5335]|uniref:DUF3592 domain-containing protein n=1 Tax=Fibrella rubiginis TaxID=2817060 RepID=A0A939GDM6_9BACT|nr:hypothetical protein [Fibrella rubiginis]MBO0937039.1 hypothetical protein [Fibrella rubiginis]